MTDKFQDLDTITVNDVNAALLRNDPEELRFVSITLALSDLDFDLIQAVCIRLCSSRDAAVLAGALASLGHLARRFRALDEQAVKPIVEAALRHSDESVRASAGSAANEIHQFLHWNIAGHVYG